MRQIWLPSPEPSMIFRIAVREVEAWLLADLDAIADFLHISRDNVPRDPETLDDPKRTLVNLARGSGSREIREDLVPRDGGGRSVGPAYTARMTEFATLNWRPEEASKRSPSLRRGVLAVQRLVASAFVKQCCTLRESSQTRHLAPFGTSTSTECGNTGGNINWRISRRSVAHYGASSLGEATSSGDSSELIMPGSRVRVPSLLCSPQSLTESTSGRFSRWHPW